MDGRMVLPVACGFRGRGAGRPRPELVQTRRNKWAALKLMRKLLKKYGFAPDELVTDDLRSYAAAAHDLGMAHRHRRGR